MKHIFILFSFLLLVTCAKAQRSQEMLTKTVKTASEVRAKNFTDNLNSKIELTIEQKDAIQELIREYLDDSEGMVGNEEQARLLARLQENRDAKAKKILKTDEAYAEYLNGIEDLKAQMGRGYGRR